MFAFYTLRNWKEWFYFFKLFYLLLEHRHNLLTGRQIFSNRSIIHIMVLPPVWFFQRLFGATKCTGYDKRGWISLSLDEKARTLRYFKESYESSHHRRVIENKLDGKSYRAWFEDPNLVHFIQKDYFSCSTKDGFEIFSRCRTLVLLAKLFRPNEDGILFEGILSKFYPSVTNFKSQLSLCPILSHLKMIFHWFGMITTILGKQIISVRLTCNTKKV